MKLQHARCTKFRSRQQVNLCNTILTEKSLRAQRAQHVRNRVVEKRHSHGVLYREPRRVAFQRAVLEGPHGVYPRLAGTVNEAAVDPTGDAIYLQTHTRFPVTIIF